MTPSQSIRLHVLACLFVFSIPIAARADSQVWLSSLDLSKAVQGWGQPGADKSAQGNPIRIGGKTYAHGFGTHAPGFIIVDLKGAATRFTATVGVDDEVPAGAGSVEFIVSDASNKLLWRSGIVRQGDAPKMIDLDLTGQTLVILRVTDGGDGYNYDHADWADAEFTTTGNAQIAVAVPAVSNPSIATITLLAKPQIYGGALIGFRPGTPVLWKVPVTGQAPLMYSATGLRPGLAFDRSTGVLSGALKIPGDYPIKIRVRNPFGVAAKTVHLVIGDQIALTPPMGWNSYDCYGDDVTESEILANARYVARTMQPYGWDTVVVDYRWYDPRASDKPNQAVIGHQAILTMDGSGRLLPAPNRFPSASDGHGFQALAAKVHAMGLRFGIHIMRGMPREAVTQNLPIDGSQYHAQDAADTNDACGWCDDMWGVRGDTPAGKAYYDSLLRLYASWGVDYVKMDDTSRPYHTSEIEAFHAADLACGRSIVYSLSPGETPISQAAHVASHANLWRISDDFWDDWQPLDHVFTLATAWQPFVGPGHWPDADMLPLGHLSVHGRSVGPDRMTRFSHTEQMTLISLWALLPAPLMVGANLPDNDPWTTNLLTNPDVLALDQDVSNPSAHPLPARDDTDETSVWMRRLSDGSIAVGLFNRSILNQTIRVTWPMLGIQGSYHVRDLWQRTDLASANGEISAAVPSHGVALYRLSPVAR